MEDSLLCSFPPFFFFPLKGVPFFSSRAPSAGRPGFFSPLDRATQSDALSERRCIFYSCPFFSPSSLRAFFLRLTFLQLPEGSAPSPPFVPPPLQFFFSLFFYSPFSRSRIRSPSKAVIIPKGRLPPSRTPLESFPSSAGVFSAMARWLFPAQNFSSRARFFPRVPHTPKTFFYNLILLSPLRVVGRQHIEERNSILFLSFLISAFFSLIYSFFRVASFLGYVLTVKRRRSRLFPRIILAGRISTKILFSRRSVLPSSPFFCSLPPK